MSSPDLEPVSLRTTRLRRSNTSAFSTSVRTLASRRERHLHPLGEIEEACEHALRHHPQDRQVLRQSRQLADLLEKDLPELATRVRSVPQPSLLRRVFDYFKS